MVNPTGRIELVLLTGYLMPWRDDQPVLLTIEDLTFLPLFSTEEKLKAAMVLADVDEYTIKQVEDGNEFLDGLRSQGVVIGVDPHYNPESRKTRWLQL